MRTKWALRPEILQRLTELGYKEPTSIQDETWKNLIEQHQDFVGQANTGSGKTIAYAAPILQRVTAKDKDVQALILVPTGELANQTAKTIFKLTKHLPKVFVTAITKKQPIEEQAHALKRTSQILVATPGRLLDLLKMNAVNLRQVKTIVLDEADELYAKGFFKEVDKILGYTNDFHRKWLFSATIHGPLTQWIQENIDKKAPKIILTTKEVINPRIEHQFISCQKEEKTMLLLEFLTTMKKARGIVFCRTKGDVEYVAKYLRSHGLKPAELYGEMYPKEREKALRMFKNQQYQYLVSTDILARGMDFEELTFVVHYQLPDDPDYYTHRSGRTARAGKRGISLILVEPVERKKMRYLQELLGLDLIQL
jgi:ATP-dependent RNA helicase DeaD